MSGYWRHLCLSVALFVATPLLAAETDPPGRVGRISLTSEGTQLRVGDSVASAEAALNWPLTTGALIETTSESRAEARIGSTTLSISGGTSLEFVEISDERIWLRLNRGSVILGIRNPKHAAEIALDTPLGRLRVDVTGTYRADVAGGTTALSAYQGTAHIENLGLAVHTGDRILLLGGSDRNYLLGQAVTDTLRQWSLVREQLETRGSYRYVSSEMTGHEELERHGRWQEIPEYGPAWFPQGMPSGWAPYRWGRWGWVSPWGWTWIDHAPWGFAPFHYGRWALIAGAWAWLPGAYVAQPVYAPALIVWLGQPGWSASFSFGAAPAVGWFPLGPREIYYPHYRSSLRHVRSINVTHVTNVARIVSVTPLQGKDRHIHRGRHEAMTIVPEKTALSGAVVNRSGSVRDKLGHDTVPVAHPPQLASPHGSKAVKTGAAPPAAMIAPPRPADKTPAPMPRPVPLMPQHTNSSSINKPATPSSGEIVTYGSRSGASASVKDPPPPPPRHATPRPMPSQAPAVAPFPHQQRPVPAVEAASNHGFRTAPIPQDSGSRHSRYREQSRPKQGPQER
jgi:hypothetical protein